MRLNYGPIHQPDPPVYDDPVNVPGPIRRSDLDWTLFVESAVVFAAICLFCFLASLVAVE